MDAGEQAENWASRFQERQALKRSNIFITYDGKLLLGEQDVTLGRCDSPQAHITQVFSDSPNSGLPPSGIVADPARQLLVEPVISGENVVNTVTAAFRTIYDEGDRPRNQVSHRGRPNMLNTRHTESVGAYIKKAKGDVSIDQVTCHLRLSFQELRAVSPSCVRRFRRRYLRLSYKVPSTLHTNKDRPSNVALARAVASLIRQHYESSTLIGSIDQSCTSTTKPRRLWAAVGSKAGRICNSLSQSVSLLCLALSPGTLIYQYFVGSVSAVEYSLFLRQARVLLGPVKLVLLEDNVRCHNNTLVDLMYKKTGFQRLKLAPYHPEHKPVELLFNVLKARAGSNATSSIDERVAQVHRQMTQFSAKVVQSFFTHVVTKHCPSFT